MFLVGNTSFSKVSEDSTGHWWVSSIFTPAPAGDTLESKLETKTSVERFKLGKPLGDSSSAVKPLNLIVKTPTHHQVNNNST